MYAVPVPPDMPCSQVFAEALLSGPWPRAMLGLRQQHAILGLWWPCAVLGLWQ